MVAVGDCARTCGSSKSDAVAGGSSTGRPRRPSSGHPLAVIGAAGAVNLEFGLMLGGYGVGAVGALLMPGGRAGRAHCRVRGGAALALSLQVLLGGAAFTLEAPTLLSIAGSRVSPRRAGGSFSASAVLPLRESRVRVRSAKPVLAMPLSCATLKYPPIINLPPVDVADLYFLVPTEARRVDVTMCPRTPLVVYSALFQSGRYLQSVKMRCWNAGSL